MKRYIYNSSKLEVWLDSQIALRMAVGSEQCATADKTLQEVVRQYTALQHAKLAPVEPFYAYLNNRSSEVELPSGQVDLIRFMDENGVSVLCQTYLVHFVVAVPAEVQRQDAMDCVEIESFREVHGSMFGNPPLTAPATMLVLHVDESNTAVATALERAEGGW